MHLAVGSSLATVVFTSITSAMAHHRHGAVRWPMVRRLSPGIVAGAALGAVLAEHAPGRFLRVFFGLFELLVAAQFAVGPAAGCGLEGKFSDTFNDIVDTCERMSRELKQVGQTVGREGKMQRRAKFGRSGGAWGEMETSINTLIDDLLWPTGSGAVWPLTRVQVKGSCWLRS